MSVLFPAAAFADKAEAFAAFDGEADLVDRAEMGAGAEEALSRAGIVADEVCDFQEGGLFGACARPVRRMARGGEEGLGVGVAHLPVEGCGLARFDDPPLAHDDEVVGDIRDHGEVVGDEHEAEPVFADELEEEIEDLRLGGDVERGCRFVGDQDVGLGGDGDGDDHALTLAA